jgi:hypothetical protein
LGLVPVWILHLLALLLLLRRHHRRQWLPLRLLKARKLLRRHLP